VVARGNGGESVEEEGCVMEQTDRRTKRRLKDDYSPTGACRPRLLAMP
jgi:hypothetical protein